MKKDKYIEPVSITFKFRTRAGICQISNENEMMNVTSLGDMDE